MNHSAHNLFVAVDVQNDFVDGSLAVSEGKAVIEPLNQLAQAVRKTMGRVAFTRDWHPATTPHFETWPVHCVAGTPGADFHPALDVRPTDLVLSKGMGQTDGYSGIEAVARDGTTLESLIAAHKKVRVFLGGLATDYCVKATAIDLAQIAQNNVDVYAITDAMRGVNLQPGDSEQAIEAMQEAGVTVLELNQALALVAE